MTRLAYGIPVLAYHRVVPDDHYRRDKWMAVCVAGFRRQMRAMACLGYQARTFGEIAEALACRRSLPRRTFAVTFDDGYQDIAGAAAPILAEYGFPATVFVVSDCVGATNAWDCRLGYPELPLLGWDALHRLMAAGWEIGGHTRSHPHLGTLDEDDACAEILGCKAECERHLGSPLRTFCYPYGEFDARLPALVRAAGYLGACTTRSGLARCSNDPFLQPRVKPHDDVAGLLYRVLVCPYLPSARTRVNAVIDSPMNPGTDLSP